jgi:hypothetical protein
VAGLFVFGARIAEADDEANGHGRALCGKQRRNDYVGKRGRRRARKKTRRA